MPTPGSPTVHTLAVTHLAEAHKAAHDGFHRSPPNIRRDDLTSAAYLALVEAAHQFDPTRGVPFGAYAYLRCRGGVVDEMRRRDWATRTQRDRLQAVRAARETLTGTLHREPTPAEGAAVAGLTEAQYTRARVVEAQAVPVELDSYVPVAAAGLVVDPDPDPEQRLLRREQVAELSAAILALPERQQRVVTGLIVEDRTGADLAAELGVSESRVSQLRKQALTALRAALTD